MGIPGTESAENPRGIMVEVYWEQDESGALCISGQSPEMPVPPNVQPMASTTSSTSWRSFLGRTGPAHGIVFDLSQTNTTESR